VTFYDPTIPGGLRNVMLNFSQGLNRMTSPPTIGMMQDVVFQHNTAIPAPSTPNCWGSIFVGDSALGGNQAAAHLTSNIWIEDSVLCRQPSGDKGLTGTTGLNHYFPWPNTPPNDITARFYGNEMYGQGGKLYTWPTGNLATNTAFTYNSQNIVTNPPWTSTAGPPAPPFQAGWMGTNTVPNLLSIWVTPSTASIAPGATQQFTAAGNYSDGSTQDLTNSSTWTSGTPATATINATTGNATAVTGGSTVISAASGGVTGAATLTVR